MTDSKKYIGMSGKYTKNGTPNGFTAITPFIVVKNPSEAIEFYKAVFNARVKDITEFSDKGRRLLTLFLVIDTEAFWILLE